MSKKFLVGYALRWNTHSFPLSDGRKRFIEQFVKGAFENSLRTQNSFVLSYHNHQIVLGRKGVNAEIYEDPLGLKFSVELPNTTAANDMFELVQKGIIKGVSVGFRVKKDKWEPHGVTLNLRTIHEATLTEFSFVPMPAYASSEVHALTEEEFLDEQLRSKDDKRKRLYLLAAYM